MNYMLLSHYKIKILVCFSFLLLPNLEAQKPAVVFAKNIVSTVEIAGAWEFDLGEQSGKRILNINQKGSVAIGTFHQAPVIVNVVGSSVKFKCDERKKNGEKVRYIFKGEASGDQISGKMSIYSYRTKTFESTELIAIKKK